MSGIFDLFDMIAKDRKSENTLLPVSGIVVGLGNPGRDYEMNRHNAGFMAIDLLSEKHGIRMTASKFHALTGDGTIENRRVLLMKPQTMMNNSGIAVREAADFYKIQPENIIVLFDDINFDIGSIRIKRKGSDGGHKGIKSIIYHLNSDKFERVKIGVGQKPHPDYDLASWVVSDIPQADRETFFKACSDAAEAVKLMLSGNTEKAMQDYN